MTRPIKSAYSMPRMLQFEARVDSTLRHLTAKLRTYENDRVCPMGAILLHFAWDVTSEVNFSKRFGALDDNPEALHLIEEASKPIKYMALVGQMPWLDDVLKSPIVPFSSQGFKYARDFAAKALSDRIKTRDYSEQRDFTDLFIDAENDKAEGGAGTQLTQRQMAWLSSNVSAGSDTVASALQAAVYYVARDASIRTRLFAELDTIPGRAGPASWKSCSGLPFLGAIVKETFRMSPSVGLSLERVVSESGLRLGSSGPTLPQGTVVGVNPRIINHDRVVFGADADVFNPDRWLCRPGEADADYQGRLNAMRQADLNFGSGRRSCMGKNIALLELHKCVASIFLDFDVSDDIDRLLKAVR